MPRCVRPVEVVFLCYVEGRTLLDTCEQAVVLCSPGQHHTRGGAVHCTHRRGAPESGQHLKMPERDGDGGDMVEIDFQSLDRAAVNNVPSNLQTRQRTALFSLIMACRRNVAVMLLCTPNSFLIHLDTE
jgi:hypothetical protein